MFVRSAAVIVVLTLFGAAKATRAEAQASGNPSTPAPQSSRMVVVGYTANGTPILMAEKETGTRSTPPSQAPNRTSTPQAIDGPTRMALTRNP